MKKVFSTFIDWMMRSYSVAVEPAQRPINAKISRQFHLWVAEKRYCRPDISVGDVAEEFGVTVEDLAYYFSTVVGERFTTVRKKLRLEEARRIICEHPEWRLRMVANRVGILDKCNFRKQFYSLYGYSPSEWQKQCAEMKREESHR